MCNTELQLIDQHWLYLWEWMNTSCLMCYGRVHRWFLKLQYYIFSCFFNVICFAFSSMCRIGWYYTGFFTIKIECEKISPWWLFLMVLETSFQQNFSQVWNIQVNASTPIHTFHSYKSSLTRSSWMLCCCFSFFPHLSTLIYGSFWTALTLGFRSVKITSHSLV